ncbi:peptide ABC transporter substrate-binding protein [Lacticaseibacillus zhaodongensis]|uniref:peptide ABC transporter substrate-binding protein n=1 Tax=Lacticaseibacillus zhaodongensis TaxID=2668065 RepID=UPI0018AFF010|nr:peptide ABC transporter substrate-binding protein [Lacticaseibacillus zhaodongensis]
MTEKLNRFAKPLLVLATSTAAVLMLAGCGNKTASKKAITVGIASEIQTMDGLHSVDSTSSEVLNNTEDGLIILGKHSKVTPGIAKSWHVSKNGLTYTYTLRKNAKWNDGTPITAKDFVYSWRRAVNLKTAAENAYMFSGIKNADAIAKSKKQPSSLGVKADGKYKLTVTLEHPISYFNMMVANAWFHPQEKKVVEKYGKKYGTTSSKTAYSGAYVLKGWDGSGSSWTLVKNKHYWNKKNIKLDDVKYQVVKDPSTGLNMFDDGQLDQVQLQGEQIANERKSKNYVQVEDARTAYVAINFTGKTSSPEANKALQNLNVRKAMSVSLDRNAFVKNVLADGSQPALGFASRDMMKDPKNGKTDLTQAGLVKNLVSYNKTAANKYWKQGLKETGLSQLTLTLLSDDDETSKAITQYLQGQWSKSLPGLTVKIKTVPKTTRVQYMMDANFDVVLTSFGPEYNDPAALLNLQDMGNTYNFGHWNNQTYHKAMATANNTANAETRWQALVTAQKTIVQDMGVVPLYQSSDAFMRNTKLKGVVMNPAGMDPGWRDAYLK